MSYFRKLLPLATVAALLAAGGVWYFRRYQNQVKADVEQYLEAAHRIERSFVETLPVYGDWATAGKERELRRFLLKRHLALAAASGLPLIQDDAGLAARIKSGTLARIERTPDSLFYFYNVPKKYRVLSPETAAGLEKIAERFQANLRKRGATAPVKIAVSSVLRPVSYQRKLQRRNANAAFASSHSYGISFDIFFDDYYVVLPPVPAERELSRMILSPLRGRLGYLLGDALARQFRSILMETLIEMQAEGSLYAILERRQRCYHVSILPGGYSPGNDEDDR